MKIKIIKAGNLEDLQDLINCWIAREKIFDHFASVHTDISLVSKWHFTDHSGSKQFEDEYIGVIKYNK